MLDARGSREIQANLLALRAAERGVRLGINKQARAQANPLWRGEVNRRARTTLQRNIIAAGARATTSDRGVALHAATRSRALRGGLVPAYQWQGAEFGATPRQVRAVRRGTAYPLWVNRQWQGRTEGVVAMDAASVTGTKIVALWVRTTVDYMAAIPAAEIVPT